MGKNYFKFADKRPELDKIEADREANQIKQAEEKLKVQEKADNYVKQYKLSIADEYNGGASNFLNPFDAAKTGMNIESLPNLDEIVPQNLQQNEMGANKQIKNPYQGKKKTVQQTEVQDEEWSLVGVCWYWFLFLVLWPWHLFVWLMTTQYSFVVWFVNLPLKLFKIKIE